MSVDTISCLLSIPQVNEAYTVKITEIGYTAKKGEVSKEIGMKRMNAAKKGEGCEGKEMKRRRRK